MAIYRVTLVTPEGRRHCLRVGGDQHVLDVALRAGLDLPYSCLQGWCLTCAVRIDEGRLNQEDSRRYYEDDRTEGFGLICTGRPESDLRLHTHARDAMRAARERHGLPYPKGDWGE